MRPITAVAGAKDALAAALEKQAFDLIIMAPDLQDANVFDFIDELKEERGFGQIPLLFYSRELTKKEEIQLKRLTQTTTTKDVRLAGTAGG